MLVRGLTVEKLGARVVKGPLLVSNEAFADVDKDPSASGAGATP
jgi:hypothetical protein